MRTRRTRLGLMVGVVAVAVGVGIGVAWAGSSGDSNGPPNTLGRSGHARPLKGTPLAPGSVSETMRAAFADAGATRAASVATVGAGAHAAQLLSVKLPDGRTCLAVSHAGGKIVEPPNCANDALLRVWTDASGSGDPATGAASSVRIIAVAAAEVRTVRIAFADGSSRTLTPSASGVVTFESSGGVRPVKVEGLAADGSSLGAFDV